MTLSILDGLVSVAPARLDLIGDEALYANTDYVKQVTLNITGGDNWDLTTTTNPGIGWTWLFLLKRRPSDADADAVAVGEYHGADSTIATDSTIIAFQFNDIDLKPSDAGELWFSATLIVTTANNIRIPVLYGKAELREFSATAAAS